MLSMTMPQMIDSSGSWMKRRTFCLNASFPIVGVGTKYRRLQRALIGTDVAIAVAMINEAVQL